MYLKYDEEKIDEIQKITDVDYDCIGNLIPAENIISMLEDLVYEYHKMKDELEEKLEDEIEQREEYYEPISKMRLAGMSERDFV